MARTGASFCEKVLHLKSQSGFKAIQDFEILSRKLLEAIFLRFGLSARRSQILRFGEFRKGHRPLTAIRAVLGGWCLHLGMRKTGHDERKSADESSVKNPANVVRPDSHSPEGSQAACLSQTRFQPRRSVFQAFSVSKLLTGELAETTTREFKKVRRIEAFGWATSDAHLQRLAQTITNSAH